MRPWRRRLAVGVGAVLAVVVVTLIATDLPAEPALYPPKAASPTVAVFVVSNGFHTGLVLPRAKLVEAASRVQEEALGTVTRRFALYDFLEFGWGEEQFYRGTPGMKDFQWHLAIRALFWPNRTVVHVVGLWRLPAEAFAGASALIRIELAEEGFRRLAGRLDASFGRGQDGAPIEIGPGLYGPSLFYRATGRTRLFNVCNNWIGRLLNAAGLADQPILSTTASGLFADLRWRSGAVDVAR